MAGTSTSDDFDYLIDNFKLEVIGSNADADFVGDSVVAGDDFLTWQRNFGATGLTPPGSNASGDANLDGKVDRLDYTIWKGQFGGLGTTATAAGDGTGAGDGGIGAGRDASGIRIEAPTCQENQRS